jgi:uncharacterized protein (UPF0332 family)
MSLTAEERHDVVTYRIEKANKTLEQVKNIVAFKYWSLIANRLYYAAYYAVSALLVASGYRVKSHEGTISQFSLQFAKSGIVSKEMGKLYHDLFELRMTGDYSDNFDLTEEDVMPLLEPTEQLINRVSELAKQAILLYKPQE